MKRVLLIAFSVMLLGLLGGLIWVYVPSSEDIAPKVIVAAKEPRNRHEADLPRVVPADKFDPRFILLRTLDRARLPIADRFVSPLGSHEGAFSYDAQGFSVNNTERGGHHAGQDLNGIGGENTDVGDAVFAGARGTVLYSGAPSPDWGKVVVLGHRLPDGRIVQTLYAHLSETHVFPGLIVAAGAPLGKVGTADGRYLAHLHYEAIDSTACEAGLPGYYKERTNRFSPESLGQRMGGKGSPVRADDIFSTLENLELQRNRSSIQFAIETPGKPEPANK